MATQTTDTRQDFILRQCLFCFAWFRNVLELCLLSSKFGFSATFEAWMNRSLGYIFSFESHNITQNNSNTIMHRVGTDVNIIVQIMKLFHGRFNFVKVPTEYYNRSISQWERISCVLLKYFSSSESCCRENEVIWRRRFWSNSPAIVWLQCCEVGLCFSHLGARNSDRAD